MSLEQEHVKADVENGDLGMFLEHAADAGISGGQLKELLAKILEVRARQWDRVAESVGPSFTVINVWAKEIAVGGNEFEKNRAQKLRELSKSILDL